MTSTEAENFRKFVKKAPLIKQQSHFDLCMELFPESMREEIYNQTLPLLAKPFTLKKDTVTS